MDDPAIEVRDLKLAFRPYLESHPTLKRSLLRSRRVKKAVVPLDGVSFDLERGGALAVIGPNGAGKSTLLRVLSGTLAPDEGSVVVRGRTSTLLQLSAGFNTELSGRKNIMLCGLARGLTKQQVRDRFDEIVEYSELAHAIDRPVKTYSSGMFSRLAFSIAMSLEPEILLVDEVLAVGDEAFKSKSEATMKEMLKRSGTLVYVTHSLGMAEELCTKALWLDHGKIVAMGPAHDVIAAYKEEAHHND